MTDNNPITTIDRDKYSNKKMVDISSRKNLYDLIGEMTYGSKATGEIANVQNMYGQLQNKFFRIDIPNESGGVDEIVLRKPGEQGSHPEFQNETMTDMLRYFLQYALDNAKYLTLKELAILPLANRY